MKNHSEKRRDMARSVLPSTARRPARLEKRRIQHVERARTKDALRRMRRAEHPDDISADLAWTNRPDRDHLIGSRRGADKVGPLIRWAEVLVKREPELAEADFEERRAHFATMLPPNKAGRHALSHLGWAIDPAWEAQRTERREHRARADRVAEERRDDLRNAVRIILALGGHRRLNEAIRRATPQFGWRWVWKTEPVPEHLTGFGLTPRRVQVREEVQISPRVLHGAHDIDDFVADTVRTDRARLVLTLATELRAARYR